MPDSRPQPPPRPPSSPGPVPVDPAPLLLSGARLTDGRTVDVRLGGGLIEAVGTAGSLAAEGTHAYGTLVDLTGYLLLPAPAEPHAHPDTALSADDDGPVSYDPGTSSGVRRRRRCSSSGTGRRRCGRMCGWATWPALAR
ncbi:hypothetical protein SHKM778_08290 [Streptomyces sp. KM77-8]|uniref:Hydrolase n=1 Tax=Streptomyces haneummycinicus TaxID=3074435 RepID=A0AAT9HAV2_9ACTN